MSTAGKNRGLSKTPKRETFWMQCRRCGAWSAPPRQGGITHISHPPVPKSRGMTASPSREKPLVLTARWSKQSLLPEGRRCLIPTPPYRAAESDGCGAPPTGGSSMHLRYRISYGEFVCSRYRPKCSAMSCSTCSTRPKGLSRPASSRNSRK